MRPHFSQASVLCNFYANWCHVTKLANQIDAYMWSMQMSLLCTIGLLGNYKHLSIDKTDLLP